MSVINSSTNQVITTITVGGSSLGVAAAPTGTPNAGDVYVTDNNGSTVSVINPNNHVIATIPVGNNPAGLAVSPAGTPNAGDV